MGLFVQQNSERTRLQERITAELNEKAKKKALGDTERPDGIDDSAYIENTKQTTSLAWVWIVIVMAVVIASIYFMIRLMNSA